MDYYYYLKVRSVAGFRSSWCEMIQGEKSFSKIETEESLTIFLTTFHNKAAGGITVSSDFITGGKVSGGGILKNSVGNQREEMLQ